jgi:hypothetical protein
LSLNRTVGDNWALSVEQDAIGSFNPAPLSGTLTVHPGGDLGTPGVFSTSGPANDADFNGDGDVDGADFLTWQRNVGRAGTATNGDANGDGDVDGQDLEEWEDHFGLPPTSAAAGAVPEPASLALGVLAIAGLSGLRRRRR